MRKKNLLVILGCIVLAMVWCTASFAAEKVGYINLQRLVNESKMGKDAKADILKMRETKQAVLNKKLADINKLRDFINQKGDKLVAGDRRDKVELLQKMYKDYQRLVADAKEDITREDRQLVAIILEKANDILK
ncbi:MAG: OmpH family outer membrane protein, partial [Desulfobacteraceae bacterium]|nr:OmpH family outer membrane protein [Desulfobacteraceae bacterium]